MCGIVGIVGRDAVAGQVIEALRRLEYRGYDRLGIATLEDASTTGTSSPPLLTVDAHQMRQRPVSGSADAV